MKFANTTRSSFSRIEMNLRIDEKYYAQLFDENQTPENAAKYLFAVAYNYKEIQHRPSTQAYPPSRITVGELEQFERWRHANKIALEKAYKKELTNVLQDTIKDAQDNISRGISIGNNSYIQAKKGS